MNDSVPDPTISRTATANPVLRATGLSKHYRSGTADLLVFENLDIDVARGERLALIGASGAGKSTLLHLLGLLDSPSAGRIEVCGHDVGSLTNGGLAEVRNREIGFVWQMSTLLPEFTALENVMMPLLIRGISRRDAASPSMERLNEVGLAGRAHHRSGELSGGEQQRVVLARALAGKPSLLLADEPTGNLDERTGEKIMDLLESLHRSHQLTSIYVTHNPAFAQRATRVLELRQGKLREAKP